MKDVYLDFRPTDSHPFAYKYPRPMVSADVVVLRPDADGWKILLIQRGGEPFKGYWALPGGFWDKDEDMVETACRELQEETGLVPSEIHQVGAYGAKNRDPRGPVVSVAHLAVVPADAEAHAADDAANSQWHALENLPPLAFDHARMIADALALARLKNIL